MSKEAKTQARVVVQVMIEVRADGTWGGDCALSQTWKQGEESALRHLDRLFSSDNAGGRVRVIGEPEVKTVIVVKD